MVCRRHLVHPEARFATAAGLVAAAASFRLVGRGNSRADGGRGVSGLGRGRGCKRRAKRVATRGHGLAPRDCGLGGSPSAGRSCVCARLLLENMESKKPMVDAVRALSPRFSLRFVTPPPLFFRRTVPPPK